MIIGTKLLIAAIDFAAIKHKKQRRKGDSNIPYINHPIKVCKILTDCDEIDIDLLLAAILHDTVEDTDTSILEIETLFGKNVAKYVGEVTDDKSLPDFERKEMQVNKAPSLTPSAKKIKIADKINNINDLILMPIDWTVNRKEEYFNWAVRVFDGCKGLNQKLDQLFVETVENARSYLKNQKLL